jgi:hypothetical protein
LAFLLRGNGRIADSLSFNGDSVYCFDSSD